MERCKVCNQPAEISHDGSRDAFVIQCQRCGIFRITGTAFALDIGTHHDMHRLSGVIRSLSESGHPVEISSTNIDDLISAAPTFQTPLDQIALLVRHIARKSRFYGDLVSLEARNDLAHLYARSIEEFEFALRGALELNYLASPTECYEFTVTTEGWLLVSRQPKIESNKAFVAMSFSTELTSIWENGIRPALVECGYSNPIRIDQVEHTQKICDKILAEIRQSGIVVADFTGHRGGVYFEAGFALGLGIPVVWTCKEDDISSAHFDTRQYNHILWISAEDLKEKLTARVRATIARRS